MPTTDNLLVFAATLMAISAILLTWGLAGVVRFLKDLNEAYIEQIVCTKKICREQEYSENRELKMLKSIRAIEKALTKKSSRRAK